jgi:hypothetical protein
MDIKYFDTLKIFENIFKIDENKREINIFKINNCVPYGHTLYYPNILFKILDDSYILPLMERTMSLKINTIYEKNSMKFDCLEKTVSNNYEDPLFFFIYNTDNYFHFLYDSLPYLISYLNLKKTIFNLKLLMQYPNEQKKEMYPFVLEFLELLDINKTDIVIVDEYTQYKELYISTSYTHGIDSNLPPRKEIYPFYQDIVNIVNNKFTKIKIFTPKKIYVSRRTWLHNDFKNIGTNYTLRRKLINEDELVEKLKNDGYEEVFTELLTTIEKIAYFSNATHVIGAIGGGISNVLFSPKTTVLEVLVSPTFLEVNNRFIYSLNNVNVRYNYNTKHLESGEMKTYMRVKTKDNKIVGEIEKIYDNKLLISYTDGSNSGWNAQNYYKQIELSINDVEKLDNGLNSPWVIIL